MDPSGFVTTFALIVAHYGAPLAPVTDLLADDATARFGAALVVLSALAFKFSLVPLDIWAPDVFFRCTRVGGGVRGCGVQGGGGSCPGAGCSLGSGRSGLDHGHGDCGGGFGNLVALGQASLRRMLGDSTIAHSGYMALVLSLIATLTGVAVLFYMESYAPALLAALCVAGRIDPDARPSVLRGLIWRNPVAGVVLSLALLSMAGLPPAVGFIGNIHIVSALAEAAAWPHLAAAILGAAATILAVGVYPEYLVTLVRSAVPADVFLAGR
jgi:NADH-quinone oxidoreductase subunit N